MSNYNTITITRGTKERPLYLKLNEKDEDNEMEISIERVTCNSFWINKEGAQEIVEHLKRQFEI